MKPARTPHVATAWNRSGTHDADKRVGIWIRVSTEDQAHGESPEHHERRARLYAEAKGWKVVTVYDLSAVSGKTVMRHPEAERMFSDLKAGRIEGLIFSKLARLAEHPGTPRHRGDFRDPRRRPHLAP